MKTNIKLGAVALAIAISFASCSGCSGKKSTSGADTAKTIDTAKKDTLKTPPPPDTSKKPTDTTKKK